MKVLLVTPDLFGSHGGIARHLRITLKALSEAPQVQFVDAIALLDQRGTTPDARYFGPRGRSYQACGGERPELIRRVTAALLTTAYDVVIAAHVNLAPLLLLRTPHHRARLNVTLVYGIDVWQPLPWYRRAALQASDTVFAISRFTGDHATRVHHLDPRRVLAVYSCPDPYLSDCGPDCVEGGGPADSSRTSLLTVARLSLVESSKGHTTVLQALPQVFERFPDVTYDVVGDGDLKAELQGLARRLGIQNRVRFLGHVSDAELRHLYHACTAYVMPSKWEGFGLAFLEAMVHSRPVIAGRRDAAPEVLADSALFVDPDDPDQLARTIWLLLSNPELRHRLGAAGRARFMEHFTYERFHKTFLSHLEHRLTQRRTPADQPEPATEVAPW